MTKPFKLYGIFGFPLAHTLSPRMQEAAFRARGVKAFYLSLGLKPEEFHRLMRRMNLLLLDGFNVTVPYKRAVIPYLDALTPEARKVGAVNTVYRHGNRWIGANTDLQGFLDSLYREGRFSPRGKKVLILGAGGGARAAVYGLAKEGAREIRIANRHPSRARRIVRDFQPFFRCTLLRGLSLERKDLVQAIEGVDLVVNATSMGLDPADGTPLPPSLVLRRRGRQKRLLFFDLVYHQMTRFLKVARKKGHRTVNGLDMLVYQGAEAFRLWTGQKAPIEVMRGVLRQSLGQSC